MDNAEKKPKIWTDVLPDEVKVFVMKWGGLGVSPETFYECMTEFKAMSEEGRFTFLFWALSMTRG